MFIKEYNLRKFVRSLIIEQSEMEKPESSGTTEEGESAEGAKEKSKNYEYDSNEKMFNPIEGNELGDTYSYQIDFDKSKLESEEGKDNRGNFLVVKVPKKDGKPYKSGKLEFKIGLPGGAEKITSEDEGVNSLLLSMAKNLISFETNLKITPGGSEENSFARSGGSDVTYSADKKNVPEDKFQGFLSFLQTIPNINAVLGDSFEEAKQKAKEESDEFNRNQEALEDEARAKSTSLNIKRRYAPKTEAGYFDIFNIPQKNLDYRDKQIGNGKVRILIGSPSGSWIQKYVTIKNDRELKSKATAAENPSFDSTFNDFYKRAVKDNRFFKLKDLGPNGYGDINPFFYKNSNAINDRGTLFIRYDDHGPLIRVVGLWHNEDDGIYMPEDSSEPEVIYE